MPPLLQNQYGLVGNQDLIQTDPMKMEIPNWESGRMNVADLQEKQHVCIYYYNNTLCINKIKMLLNPEDLFLTPNFGCNYTPKHLI